jgi:hypothetical protein
MKNALIVSCIALAACAGAPRTSPVQDLYCKLDRPQTPPTEIVEAVESAMKAGQVKREVADRWVTSVLDHDDTYIGKCGGYERQ